MNNFLKILSFIFSFFLYLQSEENSTFHFLNSDINARAVAIGGGILTTRNDVSSMFYNPATLNTILKPQASFGFQKHLLDIYSAYGCYGEEIKDFGFVGVGFIIFNYGDFSKTDNQGIKTGVFSANDLVLNLSYANKLNENISLGTNLKFVNSSIENYSSSAIALDLGVLYSLDNKRIFFATVASNYGIQLSKFVNTKETLPSQIKFSASYRPEKLPANIQIILYDLTKFNPKNFSIGSEFKFAEYLRARIGFNNKKREDLNISSGIGIAGFNYGFGIVYDEYSIDFAQSSLGSIGNLTLINIGIKLEENILF